MRLAVFLLSLLLAAPAGADPAGRFDYYVLSLSWSSGWCTTTGDARHDPQCARGRGTPFLLHGLWPQNETGYPESCRSPARDPSRAETAQMADIMGSGGLAWHEWQKHGRCSGLPPAGYFTLARRAYGAVTVPKVLAQLHQTVRVKPEVVAQAFLEANPGLKPADLSVTCDRGVIQEVRICLTKALASRPCGADAAEACRLPAAELDAVR